MSEHCNDFVYKLRALLVSAGYQVSEEPDVVPEPSRLYPNRDGQYSFSVPSRDYFRTFRVAINVEGS